MILTIQSDDDFRFSNPRYFSTIKQVSLASGLAVSSIRSTKSTQAPLTQRSNGYVYNITWLPPKLTPDLSISCFSPLTLEDKSNGFYVTSDPDFAQKFKTIHQASKCTGISYNALRNACIQGNRTITRRQKQDSHSKKVYGISWNPRCKRCVKSK